MTHLQLITKTSQDKELRHICKKIGGHLSDDLFQELMIILLEYNETKLIDIYNKGYYKWFLVKTLTNQFNSNSERQKRLSELESKRNNGTLKLGRPKKVVTDEVAA